MRYLIPISTSESLFVYAYLDEMLPKNRSKVHCLCTMVYAVVYVYRYW